MLQTIPVTSSPNQTLQTTISINNKNITLGLALRFNTSSNYWVMTISNPATNKILLDSIPLFAGVYPSGNLLQQFEYLAIGEWYVINTSNIPSDIPTSSNLGTDYIMLVGDNR